MTQGANDDLTVSKIGEFRLIAALERALPDEVRIGGASILGIGDDAAIFAIPEGERLVVTSDAMVEGVHFRLDWTDWGSLGHKLLAVNLSDLAAMGATPIGAVVTLGLTGRELVSDLISMYRGLGMLAQRFGVIVAGGDVVRSLHEIVLDLTAFGAVAPNAAVLRSGARIGDVVAVSGTLGASAAGMALLESGELKATTADLLIRSHLRPEPRLALGRILSESGVTAAMDLSDGLFGDLPKLLNRSNVSAEIDAEAIPVAAAVRALFPDRWLEMATRGGEDYELLMTIPPDKFNALVASAAAIGSTIAAIGRIVEGMPPRLSMIEEDGSRSTDLRGAFDHFG